MVVEVMGRYAGWIALNAGISGNADVILIPEIPYDLEKVAEHLRRGEEAGQRHAIVVVAEGAKPKGGTTSTLGPREAGAMERLAGAGERVMRGLEELTGREVRTVVLGHLLRGGSPSSFDRLLALRCGAAAVRALESGQSGVMVALAPPTVNYVPLDDATNRMKTVPLDSDTMLTARDLAISFGD
jgi:6-phosphofructokinase 1